MLKLLIVDDESIERKGIKFLLDKYNFNFEIAEASDGEAAYEYMESNIIDILLTDIRMPFIDGLTLSSKARNLYPDIKIIIFSAYGEFEYAKKAMDVSVVHYILKPIDENEFLSVFNKVLLICKKDEQERAKDLLLEQTLIDRNRHKKDKSIIDIIYGNEKQYKLTDFFPADTGLYIILAEFNHAFLNTNNDYFAQLVAEKNIWEHYYLNLNEFQSLIFLFSKEAIERSLLNDFGEALLGGVTARATVVIGRYIRITDDVSEEIKQLETLSDYKFFYDSNVVLFLAEGFQSDKIKNKVFLSMSDDILEMVKSGDVAQIHGSIAYIFNYLLEGWVSTAYAKYVFSRMIDQVVMNYSHKQSNVEQLNQTGVLHNELDSIDVLTRYLEAVAKSTTLAELKTIVLKCITELIRGVDDANVKNNSIIDSIHKLIEEHYMDDISLEQVSQSVYLSPNYLSYIFKKETGQSLVKYITLYRLKESAELLKNSNMKIADIGKKTGYPSSSYFCQAFRNHYGMSPAKYRECFKR